MAEQDTAKLYERLEAVARVRPEVYQFALAWLVGAARVNQDLQEHIEHAIDYVETFRP